MLLNHKHYINFNIKAMNVFSAQFSILHVSRDIISFMYMLRLLCYIILHVTIFGYIIKLHI